MSYPLRSILPVLALVLAQAAGAQTVHPLLSPQALEASRALQPQRAQQATAFLDGQDLGLGLGDAFTQVAVTTNAQGQAVARYIQTHQGFAVYGTGVTVRVDPEGTTSIMAKDVAKGISLGSALKLSQADAILAAHQNLAPSGAYAAAPVAERIVFPTVFAQGFKVAMDPTTKAPRLDRGSSLVGPRPTQTYVWGYRVDLKLSNPTDGFHEMHLIVDGTTGQVLRKWDDAAGLVPKAPRAVQPRDYAALARLKASTPQVAPAAMARPRVAAAATATAAAAPVQVQGWGHSQFSGLVSLDTIQSPQGTGYDLVDLSRPTQPHAIFGTMGNQTWFWDSSLAVGTAPALSDYVFPYLGYEYYNTYAMDDTTWSAGGLTPAGSPDNVWGDGTNYLSPFGFTATGTYANKPSAEADFHYGDANGQTAAVDAHFAMAATYDMYKNVMGRLGLDGKGSAVISVVHDNLDSFDNAHFSYVDLMMHYGDGDFNAANPNSYRTFTSVTIGGHEMSHGEMHFSAAVNYYGEGMGLNEGNSDIMGMCVEAYAKRTANDPIDQIPEGVANWVIAPEISLSGTPLRNMMKPSKDGLSPDAWYSGIDRLDGHYSMAVPNRFFYFLCEGASADTTSDAFSVYLPGGMQGIGINAGGHIWYKAVTEYMTSGTSILGIRGPLLAAATDLYGAGSTQVAAVANALAAVNLGAPANGQARPLVTFPNNLVDPNSPLASIGIPSESYSGAPGGFDATYDTVPIVPKGETTNLQVNVANTTNTQVTWSTGWPYLMVAFPMDSVDGSQEPVGPSGANGSFDANGVYTAPLQSPTFCMVQATSAADPLEFGFLPTLIANLDTDGDGEQDAVDMATFSLLYSLPLGLADQLDPGAEPVGLLWYDATGATNNYEGWSFDDFSVQAFTEAFQNAFAQ